MMVLHTNAQSLGLLAEIIGRYTTLPVSYGCQGDEVRLGAHLFIAPPDYHLIVIAPGYLGLDAGPKVRHVRPAANQLFVSAAKVYGSRVIGLTPGGWTGAGDEIGRRLSGPQGMRGWPGTDLHGRVQATSGGRAPGRRHEPERAGAPARHLARAAPHLGEKYEAGEFASDGPARRTSGPSRPRSPASSARSAS